MTENSNDPKPGFSLTSLALSLVDLFQKLLPAFLVAYSDALRQKNRGLAVALEKSKMETRVETHKLEVARVDAAKAPEDVIDQFLSDASGASGNPPGSSAK